MFVLALAGAAVAQGERDVAGPATAERLAAAGGGSADVDAMIASLGDESFVVRRMAVASLLTLGESARGPLMAAGDHGDLEIRLRSRQLLDALDVVRARKYREALESRLAEFVEDDNAAERDYDFAGWKAYRAIAGSGRAARALFADMQRAEPELLSMCEGEVEPLSRALSARFVAIAQTMSHPLPQFRTSITTGRAAALYFLASNEKVSLDARAGSQLYSFANQAELRTALAGGDGDQPLRKVVGNWIATKQDGDRNLGYYKVLLATRHGLKEGRQAGLNIISADAGGAPAHQYLQALMAVGRFGSKEDIATIEPLLKNNTICQTMTRSVNGVRTTTTVEVRDAALAVLLKLTEQNPRDYGFDQLQEHPQSLFNVSTLGFSKEDANRRNEAITKWTRWRASNDKANRKPDAADNQ